MPKRCLARDAREVFDAAIKSVLGNRLMEDCVRWHGDQLSLGSIELDCSAIDRIILVGGGKASGAMAAGFCKALGDRTRLVGHINVPEGQPDWQVPPGVTLHGARPVGVNEPTQACVEGTDRILEWVSIASERDLVVVLISGGGSALLSRPPDSVTLADKLAVIRHLSAAGCDIVGLNTVRKHLSLIKGGRLAQARRSGPMVSLILSDVLGDPVDLIASGPTVIDPSRTSDALNVLLRFDPAQQLPRSVYAHLEGQLAMEKKDAPAKPIDESRVRTEVVGNNALAVDAAGIRAESLGYNHVMHASKSSEGAAEDVGRHHAEMIVNMLRQPSLTHRNDALITGGEPVVTLADASIRGRGGRNQQLVLAAYRALLDAELTVDEWSRVALLSGGTDGEDGPTDAAGALIDGNIHRRATKLGLEPHDFLKRNDAYTFFDACGGLLITGATGTNVCDIRVALVDPPGP
ncbi:MAG: DUF4147 domain-containing protein [Planctomycetota bacterium]